MWTAWRGRLFGHVRAMLAAFASNRFAVATLSCAVCLLAGGTFLILDLESNYEDAKARDGQRLVALLARSVAREISEVQRSITEVAELAASADFQFFPASQQHHLIAELLGADNLLPVRIINSHGFVEYTSFSDNKTTSADIAVLRRHDVCGSSCISFVRRSGNAAGHDVYVSRAIWASGSLWGVVASPISVERLARKLPPVDLDPGSSISATFDDRFLMYRTVDGALHAGKDVSETPVMLAAKGRATGYFEQRSTLDGQTRIYSHHVVDGTPLRMFYGFPTFEHVAATAQKRNLILGGTALLAVLLVAIAVSFSAEISRRTALELQLISLTRVDELTQLANRRHLDECLDREWERAKQPRSPLALIMVDADYFKKFNDRYGHPEGDVLLQALAREVAATARRPADLCARFGGEEFCVLLPGTDNSEAEDVAEDLRRRIADLRIAHSDHPLGQVTVSLGVASLVPEESIRATDLIECADQALYASKRGGRNRVTSAGSSLLAAA